MNSTFFKAHGQKASNTGSFKPQLTSLVDVMTILLVFLIKSFSVEGSLITPAAGLQLPVSSTQETISQTESIEISSSAILTDGKIIARHADYQQVDSLMIEPLKNFLAARSKVIRKPIEKITLQADRDVEFNVIKRVMYTCSKAGVKDFSVLVINEDL